MCGQTSGAAHSLDREKVETFSNSLAHLMAFHLDGQWATALTMIQSLTSGISLQQATAIKRWSPLLTSTSRADFLIQKHSHRMTTPQQTNSSTERPLLSA